MIRLIWVNGRFSWPLIGAVVFFAVTLISFDLVWRLLKIPVKSLLTYATLVDLAAAVAVIIICLSLRRHNSV